MSISIETAIASRCAAASQQKLNELQAIIVAVKETGKPVPAAARIAQQTNLLALNAAVERARAGERGEGLRWMPTTTGTWRRRH